MLKEKTSRKIGDTLKISAMLNLVQMTVCVVSQCIILSLITCVPVLAISTGSLSNHDGNSSKSFTLKVICAVSYYITLIPFHSMCQMVGNFSGVHSKGLYSRLSLNGHLYKTDTSVKRTLRVCPCLSLLPLFDSL